MSLTGDTFQVLTEGWVPGQMGLARGLSDNYVKFTFPSRTPIVNEFVRVRAVRMNDQGVMGEAIEG